MIFAAIVNMTSAFFVILVNIECLKFRIVDYSL